jgi:hypothetical protein
LVLSASSLGSRSWASIGTLSSGVVSSVASACSGVQGIDARGIMDM